VRGEEGLPSVVGGAVLANAGGEFLANLIEAGIDFFGLGLGGLGVFAANLLLDEGAADELIERAFGGEDTLPDAVRVEDREADLVVDVAGQDDVAVDDGDYAVEDHGGWARGLGECEWELRLRWGPGGARRLCYPTLAADKTAARGTGRAIPA
jgi:hypothetical protein